MKKNGAEKKAEKAVAEKKVEEKKVVAKKDTPAAEKPKKQGAEKDQWGFLKDSKSSQAISMLAKGSTAKETRKAFETLSFTKLIAALEGHGFALKENGDGKCSVVKG